MLNEAALIKRLRAKDENAFRELAQQFGPRLLRAARILTGQDQLAEELVADALADAFFDIKKFKHKSSLYSWLYRILLNNFIDQIRRRKKTVILEDGFQLTAPLTDPPDKETLSIFQEHLPALLNQLSPQHRSIILYKYLEGMSVKEIARMLKIPEGTVKTRLHHGIINSRKILKDMNLLPPAAP